MSIRKSILIATDADKLWPFIADPELQARWNPRVVSMERERSGIANVGERFKMIYRMGNRERESRVEVILLDAPHRIAFRHAMAWKNSEQIVEEAYEILSREKGVRVVQTIDLSRAGMPWVFRTII